MRMLHKRRRRLACLANSTSSTSAGLVRTALQGYPEHSMTVLGELQAVQAASRSVTVPTSGSVMRSFEGLRSGQDRELSLQKWSGRRLPCNACSTGLVRAMEFCEWSIVLTVPRATRSLVTDDLKCATGAEGLSHTAVRSNSLKFGIEIPDLDCLHLLSLVTSYPLLITTLTNARTVSKSRGEKQGDHRSANLLPPFTPDLDLPKTPCTGSKVLCMMSADRPHSPATGRKAKSAVVLSRDPGPTERMPTTITTPSRPSWISSEVPTSSIPSGRSSEIDSNFRQPDEASRSAQQLLQRQSLPSMAQLTESLGQSGSVPPSYHLSAAATTDNRPASVNFGKSRKRSYEEKSNQSVVQTKSDLPPDPSHISTGLATHVGAAVHPPMSRSLTPLDSSKQTPSFRQTHSEGAGIIDLRHNSTPLFYGKADPNIDYSDQQGLTDVAGYRRDMERVEDLASRLYHFAASAGTQHVPNQAGNVSAYTSDGQQVPNASHIEMALQQCRSMAGILQTYTIGQSASSSSTGRLPPRLYNQGSTSSAGEHFPSGPTPPPPTHDYGTSFDSGDASWDYADEQAMKYRKRSAPKRLFGLGGVPAGPIPIVSAAGRPQNMHVARQALPGRCHSCNIAETPEWRRGPDGARTLCNACGLHFAKLTKKKQQSAQARNTAL